MPRRISTPIIIGVVTPALVGGRAGLAVGRNQASACSKPASPRHMVVRFAAAEATTTLTVNGTEARHGNGEWHQFPGR
jgi:hypothetical protein